MGVLQVADEPLILDPGLVDLSGGQEDLGVFAVHVVAVHVHVVEFVVRTDGLGLIIELLGRLEIVDPDVGERAHVEQHVLHGQVVLGHEIPHRDVLQIVGHAGVIDVVLQIGTLFVDLVRRHDEVLHSGAGKRACAEHDGHQDGGSHAELNAALLQGDHEQHRGDQRKDHAGPVDVQGHIDVGVPGAIGHARAGIQQVVAGEGKAGSQQQEAEKSQNSDLGAGDPQDGVSGLL